jgi:hypothetical protein
MPTKSAVPWQWAAVGACGILGLSIVSAGLGQPAKMEGAVGKSEQDDKDALMDRIKRRAGGLMPTLLPWTLQDEGKGGRTLTFIVRRVLNHNIRASDTEWSFVVPLAARI